MSIDMESGRRMAARRAALEWSQVRLAEESGISQSSVAAMELGKRWNFRNARAVAEALGVGLGTLIDGGGE